MSAGHRGLAAGRWGTLSLPEQLGNVGSEVGRAARWEGRDAEARDRAVLRALELLDLSICDPRWKGRRKELTRAREALVDAWLGGKEYAESLAALDRWFFPFAVLARARKATGD